MDDHVHILARDDSRSTPRSWWQHGAGEVMVRCPDCGTPATVAESSLGADGGTEFHCAAPRCKHASLVKLDGWPIPPPRLRVMPMPHEEATNGG